MGGRGGEGGEGKVRRKTETKLYRTCRGLHRDTSVHVICLAQTRFMNTFFSLHFHVVQVPANSSEPGLCSMDEGFGCPVTVPPEYELHGETSPKVIWGEKFCKGRSGRVCPIFWYLHTPDKRLHYKKMYCVQNGIYCLLQQTHFSILYAVHFMTRNILSFIQGV